jgi:hypothetical protein
MERQSVQALDLLTTSDEIISSIETHGVDVAAKLEEQWQAMITLSSTPQVDGPEPPNFLGHLFALKDGLAVSATGVNEADQRHVHGLANLIQLRDERNNLTEDAYGKFSTMRRAIDELQGPGKAFVLAGIEGPTSRKTPKLLRQMDLAVPRLFEANPQFAPSSPEGAEPVPDSGVEGINVDPKAMGQQLQGIRDRLRQKHREFRRMIRKVQASRKEKNRRLLEHKERQLWTARIVEGYYRLAGETELADRLRPATVQQGRPSRPATPGDSPGEPDAGVPDEGTAGGPAEETPTPPPTTDD